MSRVSLLERLYTPKKKGALEFDYDSLGAPPIRFLLSQQDIDELYYIATSLRYNGDIERKYELIDAVMRPRGFRRGNRGTNRVVYNFLEDTSFCMKIALDRVGIKDSPAEFINQSFFKPFCCKIFEVDPTGVIACIERVNPISSLEEFTSIADDVFNMMVTKIIGKYVVDDLGTEKFMNYGIRYNSNGVAFGPVVIDFPYAYELDGAKLHCAKPIMTPHGEVICNGEIDYDAGLNNLVCSKCGRTYTAKELAKNDTNVIKFYSDQMKGEIKTMRVQIVRTSDNKVIADSGRSSRTYVTREEYEEGVRSEFIDTSGAREVTKTIPKKHIPLKKRREQFYTDLQIKAYKEYQKRTEELFNPVIETGRGRATEVAKTISGSIEEEEHEAVEFKYLDHFVEVDATTHIPFKKDEKQESEDEEEKEFYDINDVIVEALHEAIEDKNEDTISNGFSEEMEREAFPELDNPDIEDTKSTINVSDEISDSDIVMVDLEVAEEDAKDYFKDEYKDEDDVEYAQYFKNNKANKRAAKNHKKNKSKRFKEDMSDY